MALDKVEIAAAWTTDPGWETWPVLDVRPATEFAAGHLIGAVSYPLAPGPLEDHLPSIFLPPRHVPLLVVAGNQAAADRLAADLAGRGRDRVQGLGLASGDIPRHCLETGPSGAHLWAAPDWLTAHADLLPPPAAGPVLDLGCGSGRAAVWLAERGYAVTGMDREVEALEMGRVLAASRGTACDFRAADLRDPSVIPAGPWSVILNFRYLQRDILPLMPRLLRPGGVVLLRTFRDAPGYSGHPHPKHRLARGDLLKAFPRGQFDILAHAEDFDGDGRPAAGIVARRN